LIRIATLDDIPAIVALGSRSMVDGPYAGKAKDNPEQSARLARYIIEGVGRVFLWELNGHACGIMALILFDHHFTADKTVQELIWYVEPEHRRSSAGLDLYIEAKKWAREMGAKFLQFSAPTEQVGQMYVRDGFDKMEVLYQKELR